ncbi:MAG: hypothetical protein ACJ789_08725 [Thermomicrobiales bacterium]
MTATAEAGAVKESSENARVAGAGAFMLQGGGGTPRPEDRCHVAPFPQPETTATLQEYAVLATQVEGTPESERPLCFIEVDLVGGGSRSTSRVFPGEATTFYVGQGQIKFTNDGSKGATKGFVRVDSNHLVSGTEGFDPDRDGTWKVEAGDSSFDLEPGGRVDLDNQCNRVDLIYENTGDGTAVIYIASAPKDEKPEPTSDGSLEDTPAC